MKISEVKIGSSTNGRDEFVELYNAGGQAINLNTLGLKLHLWDGTTDTNAAITFMNSTIPANGFFLLTTNNYSGTTASDAVYATTATAQIVANGGVYISLSATADASIIDKVGWGTSTKKEGTAAADIVANTSIERKAMEYSTAAMMISSGTHYTYGNGSDEMNNLIDFVVQATPVPQNSFSNSEFAWGSDAFSGGDTTPPAVLNSFPNSGMTMVPSDLQMVGIDFSEALLSSSVTTSTVSLVRTGSPTNLCTTVAYNPASSNGADVVCNIGAANRPLQAVVHTFTMTTDIEDVAGNNITAAYAFTFTPSATATFSSSAAPGVVGGFPMPGITNFPPNSTNLSVNFNMSMSATTLTTAGNITLYDVTAGASETITGISAATIVDPNDSAVITVGTGTFTAGSQYRLRITTSIQSSGGVAMPLQHDIIFTAGGANDSTAPMIVGVTPANSSTGVPVGGAFISAATDDALLASSVTSTSVQLLQGASVIPTTVIYNASMNQIQVSPNFALDASTAYIVRLDAAAPGAVESVTGAVLQDTDGTLNDYYQWTFTTGSADSGQPSILFATSTQTMVNVSFSEPVIESEAENINNYTLTSPGATAVTLSALSGSTVTYDPMSMSVTLSGLSLTSGNSFTVSATGIHDLAGNLLTTASASGNVMNETTMGTNFGPGANFEGEVFDMPSGFSGSTYSYVPQPSVMPMSGMAGTTSKYMVDVPISEQVRAVGNNGKVVLTFPAGFTVTGAAEMANSPANNDANGPGPGTVAVNAVTANTQARTVTVDFSIATRCGQANTDPCVTGDEHDFLHFDLSGIVNTAVPREWGTEGYTVDIKTMTSTTVLETMTSMPFYIQAAGANTLTVNLTAGSVTSASTVVVRAMSWMTGEMSATSTAFVAGAASATFSNVPNGDFWVFTDPVITLATTDDFLGVQNQQSVMVDGNETLAMTLASTAALQTVTVNVTGATGKDIDVFASGQQGFNAKRISNTDGTDSVTVKLQNGTYRFGIGPHMETNGGWVEPTPPDYTVSPTDIEVTTSGSGCVETSGTANNCVIAFALTAATATINVSVVDNADLPISDAKVFVNTTSGGFSTFGTTETDGTASLAVAEGSYRLGAFLFGAPPSEEISVVVDGSGNVFVNGASTASSVVTIKLGKADNAISGTVTDGTNPANGANVNAYCSSNCTGMMRNAFAMTNSSGSYTLYLSNGTWSVGAHLPGYGELPRQTVTVSNANQTDINFQPSSSVTYRTISGTVCRNSGASCSGGTAIPNAFVYANSTATGGGSNSTISGADGTYTLRVPAATGYRLEAFDPTIGGKLPPKTGVDTTSANQTSQDIVVGAPNTVTINFKDALGVAVTMQDVFVELSDATTDIRIHNFTKSGSSMTLSVPSGTYKVFGGSRAMQFTASSVTTDDAVNTVVTAGAVTVNGSEAIKFTIPAIRTVTGTVSDGTNPVENAWVELANPTEGIFIGDETDSSGNYSISVPDGTYQLNAYKYGLVVTPITLVVNGAEEQNLTGSVTTLVIRGTVTASSVGVSSGFVRAEKQGGGVVTTMTDSEGEYDLPVTDGTWTVTAVGPGYAPVSMSSNVQISGASDIAGNDIALTTAVSLEAPFSESFTPSNGGTYTDDAIGLELTVPEEALGTSTSSGTINMEETNSVVDTTAATVIGNGFELSAVDAGGTAITTGFADEVTVDYTMTIAELDTENIDTEDEVNDLVMSYYDSTGTWIAEATSVTFLDATGDTIAEASVADDLSNVTLVQFSAAVDHFTVFSITAPADGIAPGVPSGLSATSATGAIRLNWTATTLNADATTMTDLAGYEIYRDTSSGGSFTTQVNTSDVVGTTYLDESVADGTTYFYKITAGDTGGNESTKSSTVSAIRGSSSGSGGGSSSGSAGATTTTTIVDANTANAAADPISAYYPSRVSVDSKLPSTTKIGGLVKLANLPAVYFVGGDGLRHPFPNEQVYFSWYEDFGDVKVLSQTDISKMTMGDAVRVRPGTWMIKIQSDPKVYALEPGGILRWVKTEAAAKALFGDTWNKQIVDVEPTYFQRYTRGSDLDSSAQHPKGSYVKDTTGAMFYITEDNKLRKISSDAAKKANRIQARFIRSTASGDKERTSGDEIKAKEDVVLDFQDIGRKKQ
ncbi:MAG: carboxypeptidase regulatory-like domain-containing protein [Patescibacteria group bacterium]